MEKHNTQSDDEPLKDFDAYNNWFLDSLGKPKQRSINAITELPGSMSAAHIFSRLSFKDLCNLRLTCRSIRQYLIDNNVWKQKIPLSQFKLYVPIYLRFGWTFSTVHLSANHEKVNKEMFPVDCPFVKSFELTMTHSPREDFSHNRLTDSFLLPKNLTSFSLTYTETIGPQYLLTSFKNSYETMTNIRFNSTYLDVANFTVFSNLQSLHLDCVTFSDPSTILAFPQRLKKLSLISSDITDWDLAQLPSELVYLNISHCTRITCDGISLLPQKIETLIMKSCTDMKTNIFRVIPKSLKHLDISSDSPFPPTYENFLSSALQDSIPSHLEELVLYSRVLYPEDIIPALPLTLKRVGFKPWHGCISLLANAIRCNLLDYAKMLLTENQCLLDLDLALTFLCCYTESLITEALGEKILYLFGALIEKGANINGFVRFSHTTNTYGDYGLKTPLSCALKFKSFLFEKLIDLGADVNLHNDGMSTILWRVVKKLSHSDKEYFYLKALRLTLSRNGDPNWFHPKRKQTVFFNAVMNCMIHVVERLIESGANVNIECNIDENTYTGIWDTSKRPYKLVTPFFLSILCKSHSCATALIEKTENLFWISPDTNRNVLHILSRKILESDVFVRIREVAQEKDINLVDNLGRTPIFYSFFDINLLTILHEKGADLTVIDNYGDTPLHVLINRDFYQIELADYFNKLSQPCQEKKTIEFIQFFLRNGVDINHKNGNGQTILHLCIQNRLESVTKFLLNRKKHPVNPNVFDNSGRSPLYFAFKKKKQTIMHLLLMRGANPLIEPKCASTIFNAIEARDTQYLNLLLEYLPKDFDLSSFTDIYGETLQSRIKRSLVEYNPQRLGISTDKIESYFNPPESHPKPRKGKRKASETSDEVNPKTRKRAKTKK